MKIKKNEKLSEVDFIKEGFTAQSENNYCKEQNGRLIRCYPSPIGGGWRCEILPLYEPVANDNITTLTDLKEFIDKTCSLCQTSGYMPQESDLEKI